MLLHLTATSLDPDYDGMPTKKSFSKPEIIIGRLPSCDLPLSDSTISATHAKLSVKKDPISGEDKVYIEDLGSSNGTSIESNRLSPFTGVEVEPDQWIRAGQYLIKAVLDTSSKPLFKAPLSAILENGSDLGLSSHLEGSSEVVSSLINIISPFKHDLGNEQDGDDNYELTEEVMEAKEDSQSVSHFKGMIRDHDLTGLDFEAFKIVLIQGIATNSDGTPIAGVQVNGGELGVTCTADDGSFSFGPVREGTPFEITASYAGYNFENDRLSGNAQDNLSLEFRVIKTFSVSGRVIRNGLPLSDVLIDAGKFGSTKTDGDGRYTIFGVPPNVELEIKASKDGFGFGRHSVEVPQ